ncbi:hypothetical protein C8J57DRAFT_1496899 [Mycena rebaudengoi]|nr:hypothetical protein C8J57DRAFT_1496899 [Mycena rebaudengoi]
MTVPTGRTPLHRIDRVPHSYRQKLHDAVLKDLRPPYDGSQNRDMMFDKGLRHDIEQWLPLARRRLTKFYRARVELVRQMLVAVEIELECAEEAVEKNAGLTGVIWKTPRDVWAQIFAYVEEHRREHQQHRYIDSAPWFLTQVCSSWRKSLGSEDLAKVLRIVCMLRASRDCETRNEVPKGIRCIDAVVTRFTFLGKTTSDVILDLDDGLDAVVLSTALSYSGTWRHLSMTNIYGQPTYDGDASNRGQLDIIRNSDSLFESMESLFLNGGRRDSRSSNADMSQLPEWVNRADCRDTVPPSRGGWRYPRLTCVYLHNMVLPEEMLRLPWGQLDSYEEDRCIRGGRFLAQNHLSSMTRLRFLTLNGVFLPSETVLLQELECFDYTMPTTYNLASDPMRSLEAPRLTALLIGGGNTKKHRARGAQDEGLCLHCCVHRFLKRWGTQLITLEVELMAELDEDNVAEMLGACPALREFSVRRQSEGLFTPGFLKYLQDMTHVPALEILRIPDPSVRNEWPLEAWCSSFTGMWGARRSKLRQLTLTWERRETRWGGAAMYRMPWNWQVQNERVEPTWRLWGLKELPYEVWLALRSLAQEGDWPYICDEREKETWGQGPWG